MAVRKCPQCLHVLSIGEPAAYTDSMECPECHTPLEVSTGSRMIAIWLGLAAGYGTWLAVRGSTGTLGWALVVLLPFLAFAAVSALLTIATADLRKREVIIREPIIDDHAPSHGHAAAHH